MMGAENKIEKTHRTYCEHIASVWSEPLICKSWSRLGPCDQSEKISQMFFEDSCDQSLLLSLAWRMVIVGEEEDQTDYIVLLPCKR